VDAVTLQMYLRVVSDTIAQLSARIVCAATGMYGAQNSKSNAAEFIWSLVGRDAACVHVRPRN